MNELKGRDLLRALYQSGQCIARFPDGHASVTDAIDTLQEEVDLLTSAGDATTIIVSESSFMLGGTVLQHASVEFNSMLHDLRRRRIESITFLPKTNRQDLIDLAALVSGSRDDVPASGTIHLNAASAPPDGAMSGLHESYASSLGALRDVSTGGLLQLDSVMPVVEHLLSRSAKQQGASLMLSTVRGHDEYTFYHSVNVCILSLALGRVIGLGEDQLRHLGVGALLHDIGKVVVDAKALKKAGRLTNEEWATIKLHPQEGAQAIMAATGAGQDVAAAIALEHHCGVDGSGYPDIGHEPHFFSRLVSVADAYDAITSHRPHRPAYTPNEALRMILSDAGTRYDPDLVQAFIHLMGVYPPGSLIRAEDGSIVLVVRSEGPSVDAVLVRDSAGDVVRRPTPVVFGDLALEGQVLPAEAGVDPAALLEVLGVTRLDAPSPT